MCCGIQLQTLFVLPCADLVCTECIDSKTTSCPVCDSKFDADDFQRLQPGLVYEWKWNLEEAEKDRESARRLRNTLADAIRNNRGGGRNPAHGEVNQQNEDAVQILPQQRIDPPSQRRRRKLVHQCVYPSVFTDGKCQICHEEHFDCDLVNERSECSICHRMAEECPEEESKARYVTHKLLELRNSALYGSGHRPHASRAASRFTGEEVVAKAQRPLKVILFSQFRQILNVVGNRLLRRLGGACVAEYWGKTRNAELEKFAKSSACFCMLLGRDGSHGLDLSFVTHIFFLDEIWDKSLENQVISRAWRMGATGHVEVEQLIAKNSVEETMETLNQKDSSTKCQSFDGEETGDGKSGGEQDFPKSSEATSSAEKKTNQAKLHYLLRNLKLVRNYVDDSPNEFAQLSGKKRKLRPIHIQPELRSEESSDGPSGTSRSRISRVRFEAVLSDEGGRTTEQPSLPPRRMVRFA